MGFWEKQFADEAPQQPAPTPQTVAPGGWWQTEKQRWEQAHSSHTQQQVQQMPTGVPAQAPQPPSEEWENCPRCRGPNYILMPSEAGGDFRNSRIKWCYDCRYPGVDASGTVTTKSVNRTRGKGRVYGTPGVGAWAGSAGEAAVIGRIDE